MIENIYAHKGEDHAIRQFALGLERFIAPFAAKKDLPYATAILRLIADAPSTFRECGYSFVPIQFINFKRKGKKLVSCEAYFNIPKERTDRNE